jgi:hypothetical protein
MDRRRVSEPSASRNRSMSQHSRAAIRARHPPDADPLNCTPASRAPSHSNVRTHVIGLLYFTSPLSFPLPSPLMVRIRPVYVLLSILGLFLLGTVVVLSSVSYYLAINNAAYLTEFEVPALDSVTRWNATEHGQIERIPRILHQTWKTETLPTRWQGISQGCRDMMPD